MIAQVLSRVSIVPFAYRIVRWHLRYLLFRRADPLSAGLYITTACNFECSFCNIRRVHPPATLREEDARQFVQALGRKKVIYFSISGGEPLLIPYVFDLLAWAKQCGILYTHVVSNGYLMNEARARRLEEARVSEISFSIDGPEELHDKTRGMPGAYQRVLEAVRLVRTHAPGTRIVLNTILRPRQPEYALYAVQLAAELGVRVKVQPENDHPDFGLDESAPASQRALSSTERATLLEAIATLKRAPNVANSRPFLEHYKNFLLRPERLIFRDSPCIYGHHHIECFDSRVFPCLEGMQWQGGFNIREQGLDAWLESPEYARTLRELRSCPRCRRNYYVCYYEPRLNFPIWNFLRARLR